MNAVNDAAISSTKGINDLPALTSAAAILQTHLITEAYLMLYLYSPEQQDHYHHLLQEALPDWSIACWPQEVNAEAVTHVVVTVHQPRLD